MRFLVLVALLGGCQSVPDMEVRSMAMESDTTPAAILARNADWKSAYDAVALDAAAVAEIQAAPAVHVDVYLGEWCGDSRREVTRYFRLEEQGVPVTTTYVSLGRDFRGKHDLEAVPTFVVSRDGVVLGRIIETAPNSLEADLASLVTGRVTGRISATR
ncbi:MAG: hypothetical protein R3E66_06980 [bacterium]